VDMKITYKLKTAFFRQNINQVKINMITAIVEHTKKQKRQIYELYLSFQSIELLCCLLAN